MTEKTAAPTSNTINIATLRLIAQGIWDEAPRLRNGGAAKTVADAADQIEAMASVGIRQEREIERLREALACLLPGLTLDLRYATEDDDKDAMRSRIETVREALSGVQPFETKADPLDAWRDMASAPKDGTRILALVTQKQFYPNTLTPDELIPAVVRWTGEYSEWSMMGIGGLRPTLWQPIVLSEKANEHPPCSIANMWQCGSCRTFNPLLSAACGHCKTPRGELNGNEP